MLLTGHVGRLVGYAATLALTRRARQGTWRNLPREALFCTVCAVPKASIQGVLAGLVASSGTWRGSPQIVAFFQQTAGVILVVNSIVGVVLVEGLARKTARPKWPSWRWRRSGPPRAR